MSVKPALTRADKLAIENADGQRKWRNKNMRVAIGKFNTLVGQIRGAAHKCGYAIAVHGSLLRDIDLLAAPWTKEAQAPTTLLKAILEGVKLFDVGYLQAKKPTKKPHGRLAWVIHVGGTYIDLSVMPRRR